MGGVDKEGRRVGVVNSSPMDGFVNLWSRYFIDFLNERLVPITKNNA